MFRYTVCALILVAATSVHCASTADGRGVSAGQQCRDRNYNAACRAANPADRCTELKCTYTGRGDIPTYDTYSIGPAKQGTWCGDRKICVAGKCVDDLYYSRYPAARQEEEYDCESEDDVEDDSDDLDAPAPNPSGLDYIEVYPKNVA